jgi:hypothetical protein
MNAGPRVKIAIQDAWKPDVVGNGGEAKAVMIKYNLVHALLQAAQAETGSTLCINFASANSIPFLGPYDYAIGWSGENNVSVDGINVLLARFFNEPANRTGHFGIILLDYAETPEELLSLIIRTNFR